ncbi:MAG TPA: type IV toxin-antitoxin system AbiEi family antitoxin domain-containing protein [Streptosporangiaceae bacterium]|nr:type IV toxin-antitoxin system AbiEi family antitoxin domain-containing protein [Streptosporangiaceae bacterium]
MSPESTPAWLALLKLQSGIVSRGQALRAGLDDDVIENRLRSGRWRAVHRGTYATFSGQLSREAMLWAAILRAGPGAALSHQTAAELHGLSGDCSEVIHLTVSLGRHPGPIRGAVVHRSGRIAAATHPVQLPPRTRVEETVIDLTQSAASFDEAYDWVCRAISGRLTTAARLRAALDARPKVRWRTGLTVALAEAGSGLHSILERQYVRDVEVPHGLPAATRQARTAQVPRSRYVDNLYGEAGLAVELDGQAAHGIEQRRADMRRDNAHAAAGIVTLRYSWADVTERPCAVAMQIAEVMASRGAPVSLRPCSHTCPVPARRRRRPS